MLSEPLPTISENAATDLPNVSNFETVPDSISSSTDFTSVTENVPSTSNATPVDSAANLKLVLETPETSFKETEKDNNV